MSLWVRLRSSFWFVPAVLCLAAVVLAEGLIQVDQWIGDSDLGLVSTIITRVGESGSRDLLGAIAGSMLTVASTTFSITIAVLALSSSTYGPRLVRNFLADRGNQFVLGIFVATFLYSLMVLRSIRVIDEGDESYFVPHLAVNVAVLLAVASIGVLVYFIHHISDSVQVWTLAQQVHTGLLRAVDRLYPTDSVRASGPTPDGTSSVEIPSSWAEGTAVVSDEAGYVQSIDIDHLVALAARRDQVIKLEVRPGEHVVKGRVLARTWPPATEDGSAAVRGAVHVGRARTPEEDVEFAALLLEEMAVRALSPGTNDPYTAINALDHLTSGLTVLAGRTLPSPRRYDGDGHLRVVAPTVSLTDLLDHVIGAMRTYALEHPTVLHRTLSLIDQVGDACHDPALPPHLDGQVRDLLEAYEATSPHARDLDAMTREARRVREKLVASPPSR